MSHHDQEARDEAARKLMNDVIDKVAAQSGAKIEAGTPTPSMLKFWGSLREAQGKAPPITFKFVDQGNGGAAVLLGNGKEHFLTAVAPEVAEVLRREIAARPSA